MSVENPLIAILGVSDRAARGEYEDRGGPAAEDWLRRSLPPRRFRHAAHSPTGSAIMSFETDSEAGRFILELALFRTP